MVLECAEDGCAMDVGLQGAAELNFDFFFMGEVHLKKGWSKKRISGMKSCEVNLIITS